VGKINDLRLFSSVLLSNSD